MKKADVLKPRPSPRILPQGQGHKFWPYGQSQGQGLSLHHPELLANLSE